MPAAYPSTSPTAADAQAPCVGILLAAGSGSRFRAAAGVQRAGTHKLMQALPDGRPIAIASASTLAGVLPDSIAVVAGDPPELPGLLARAGLALVQVPQAPRGMGISLAAAARHLLSRHPPGAPLPACAVALADMPWVQPATLRALLQHAAHGRIVVPVCDGRRGHPVIFGGAFVPELALLEGDSGARALLQHHGAVEVACDRGILRDVDLPGDL